MFLLLYVEPKHNHLINQNPVCETGAGIVHRSAWQHFESSQYAC
jgi:hypothetical protein